jgi:quercetin dioxygenase-like cupin family protein
MRSECSRLPEQLTTFCERGLMNTSTDSTIRNEPFKSEPSNSTLQWSLGAAQAKLIVHASGRQTGLACSISEHIWEPGDAGGFHTHLLEDEAFYVIEGEITVRMPDDDRVYTAGAGELIWHPRGRKHDYEVSATAPVRLLQILVPGTDLVPGFFAAIAEGAANNIGSEAGARDFFDWSRRTYGVEFHPGP